MTQRNGYEKLFKAINHQLEEKGILVKIGVLIDLSVVIIFLKPKGK